MVGATLRENLDLQFQTEGWLIPSWKTRFVGNMRFFLTCQIDVVNKQLVPPISWNNPLPETALGESYILVIYRDLQSVTKTTETHCIFIKKS